MITEVRRGMNLLFLKEITQYTWASYTFTMVLCFVPFPWQQKQPDSIHLGSEELCGGAEPATKVRRFLLVGQSCVQSRGPTWVENAASETAAVDALLLLQILLSIC